MKATPTSNKNDRHNDSVTKATKATIESKTRKGNERLPHGQAARKATHQRERDRDRAAGKVPGKARLHNNPSPCAPPERPDYRYRCPYKIHSTFPCQHCRRCGDKRFELLTTLRVSHPQSIQHHRMGSHRLALQRKQG